MIDRTARDELAHLIDRYLGEQISAFKFDKAIDAVRDRTEDATVREIVDWLWFHYDDLVDHPVVAGKAQWDWFQRMLLVLRSDGEFVRTQRREWTVRQPIAALGVVAFAVAAWRLGFTEQLLLPCVSMSCLSAALCWWRNREDRSRWHDLELIFPFSSVSEMLGIRRRTGGFAKRRYPDHLRDRRIRGRAAEVGMWIRAIPFWLLISPLVLLAQAFPEDASGYEVAVR